MNLLRFDNAIHFTFDIPSVDLFFLKKMLLVVAGAEGDEIRAQVRRVEQNGRPADTWQDDSKKGERGEDNFFRLPPPGKTRVRIPP